MRPSSPLVADTKFENHAASFTLG